MMNRKKSKKVSVVLVVIMLIFAFIRLLAAIPSHAMTNIERKELQELDPQTRIEQSCNIEAMARLKKETKYSSDKVLAYAFSDPKLTETHVIAKGAAFRARGNWYHLSYDCSTESDYITIRSFKYTIGEIIPRENWDEHYLVP